MKQYVDLVRNILNNGENRDDRTGTGTRSIFGANLSFDLRERFPLVTIKKTLWKSAFIEMLWFLRGESNTKFLKDHNVPIWDAWADKDGNLGPIYGVQWRQWKGKIHSFALNKVLDIRGDINHPLYKIIDHKNFIGFASHQDIDTGELIYQYQESIDQIAQLIDSINNNYTGRRHIVTAWNPGFIKEMGLPPCHRDFQCYVSNDGHLDLMMSIRSNDIGLGNPFNVAQYALLTHLIARATNLTPRFLKVNIGDAHLYNNHIEQMLSVINERDPIEDQCRLIIKTDNIDIDKYSIDDFEIEGYESHPFVKLPIAI